MVLSGSDYSALLGYYLGDGSISEHPRSSRMRIALDAAYPAIIEEVSALLRRCFPENKLHLVSPARSEMFFVSLYSQHWPCLLPQHGRGPKHERPIVLEPWQREHFERHPWPFLRACIQTDGCSFVNRTGKYEYRSYSFVNRSADIARLFEEACERVGVSCRLTNGGKRDIWQARINRRADVARFEKHVGFKA